MKLNRVVLLPIIVTLAACQEMNKETYDKAVATCEAHGMEVMVTKNINFSVGRIRCRDQNYNVWSWENLSEST